MPFLQLAKVISESLSADLFVSLASVLLLTRSYRAVVLWRSVLPSLGTTKLICCQRVRSTLIKKTIVTSRLTLLGALADFSFQGLRQIHLTAGLLSECFQFHQVNQVNHSSLLESSIIFLESFALSEVV